MKKITIYVDMDGVLADYHGHADELKLDYDSASKVKGFFKELKPIPGALEAYRQLSELAEVYILSAASWSNPYSFSEKVEWIKKYLPSAVKRAIFSDHKDLLMGDVLIDDRTVKGAGEFKGELIQFGTKEHPDWDEVVKYITKKYYE